MRLATLSVQLRSKDPGRPVSTPPILCAVDVEAVQVFTSILALAAAALAVAVLGAWLFRGRNATSDGLLVAVGDAALWLAFLIAAVATAGSLYYSEVADFIPCRLCWFQRIAMYPLAVILLVAAIRRDWEVWRYAVPIAAIGASVSIYHYLIEWQPDLEVGDACSATGVSCSTIWYRELGFVTLAFSALCGFVAVTVLTAVGAKVAAERELAADPERLEA